MAVELAGEQKGKRLAVEDVQTMSAIRNLPARSVVVISNVHECERHLQSIDTTVNFIGLDCEWVSKGKENRPVALLQVATPHRDCFLIRLNKLQSVPESLQRILSNKRLLKFGVGIMEDRKRLFQRTLVLPVSCVDLRNVAALCGLSGSLSLAALAKELTGTDLDKDSGVRRGDWEADTLSPAQIAYAAMDALVAVDIISALVNRKLVLDRGEHTDSTTAVQGHFVHWDTPEFNDVLHSMCEPFLDIGRSFKASSVNQDAPLRATSAPVVHQSPLPPQRTKSYSLRKTPLYDNCQLLAPDGQLLSTIDRRKMNWYLQRGLAEVVTENPPTIMTNFEPAGRPGDEREYYLTEKENRCVVCGRVDSYIRKNVVPHEYRRFFPAQHKEHLSHDVLLLCVNCHQLSSQHDTRRRQSLAAECNAPLHLSMPKQNEDSWLAQVKSHSKALLRCKDIPQERRRELLSTLQQHFGVEEVTKEMMEEGAQIDTKSKLSIERSMSHGQKVVQIVLQQQRLLAFQQEWRQHFVDTMHPKYLPDLWSVSHNPAAPDLEPFTASWGVTIGFFISTAVQVFCLYTVLRETRQ